MTFKPLALNPPVASIHVLVSYRPDFSFCNARSKPPFVTLKKIRLRKYEVWKGWVRGMEGLGTLNNYAMDINKHRHI